METRHGFKYRQLHIEDYLREIPAEQGRVTGVYAHGWMAGDTGTNTDFWTDNLLDTILRADNMNTAYKKVKANKGSGGIDGMQVDELLPYLKEHRTELAEQIRGGKYKPNPVRRVEIPKVEKGKIRKLGVPTVVDRVIQQAVAQELTPISEEQLSENSFGFRPRKGAHDALKKCREYAGEGYVYAVNMDLQPCFDTVSHSKPIEVMSRTVKDGWVIPLIHKYLRAGVMEDGAFQPTEEGVPQGGPLSPLCGNIMLNGLDRELERRGHKFVRYADDCMIMCRSKKSAERTLENIVPFITGKLFLKVNLQKTTVGHISKVKYLGYGFYRHKGKCRMRVHPKSETKMKNRLRELTVRGNRWSSPEREKKLNDYVRGWINYYKYADMKSLIERTDEWLRRRIRAVYWKQWKRVRTRYKMLRALRLPEWKVHEMANCRKGTWRAAGMLNSVLTKTIIVDRLGYPSMSAHYLKVRVNY